MKIPEREIEEIRKAALAGARYVWVANNRGVILASKYGPEWWQRATAEDMQRIVVS